MLCLKEFNPGPLKASPTGLATSLIRQDRSSLLCGFPQSINPQVMLYVRHFSNRGCGPGFRLAANAEIKAGTPALMRNGFCRQPGRVREPRLPT